MPLAAGRLLEATDNDSEPAFVVIEKRLAERLWPGEDALGQRLFFQISSLDPVAAQGRRRG